MHLQHHLRPLVVFLITSLLAACAYDDGLGREQRARRESANGIAANGAELLANSCSVTPQDVSAAANELDQAAVQTTPLMRATTQLQALHEATKKVDAKLQEHFARVAPALDDNQVMKLATVFEDQAKVVVKILRDDDYFDDVELSVKEIRTRHFNATKKLAATLDAIDSTTARAERYAPTSELRNAYVELSDSPCPARSLRYAAILFSLGDTPNSPYIAAKNGESNAYASLMLVQGLANAVVERSVENTTGKGDVAAAPEKALAEIRSIIATTSGVTNNVMSFFQSRSEARARALDPDFVVSVDGHDLTPTLRTVNAVLFWWNVSEAAASGNVGELLKSSPAIAESAAKGVAALAGHFEATRIAGAATNVAESAGYVARVVGVVFATKSIIDTLDKLDDPHADTKQLVVSLVGQCMVLAGSFMPPPLGFAVVGIGTIAVWISTLIGDPPPDELAPLLDQLVKDKVLGQDEKVAITEAHASNISALGRSLKMKPADVRWTLTTARLTDKVNLGKTANLFGDETMGIFRIHLETKMEGDAMAAYLRNIARSAGNEGRLEMNEFLTYTAAPLLFNGVSVKQAITNRRDALDEYDVKYDAQDVGITASRGLTLTRDAFTRAITGLP